MNSPQISLNEKLLNVPSQARKVFARHFLSAVHCEIGFAGTAVNTILSAEDSLKIFFKSVGFESCQRFMQKELSMETPKDEPPIIRHSEIPLGLMFSSQKPRIDVQVLDTKIVISDFNYDGFEQFNERLKKICQGVSKFVPRTQVRKVGLRKVDSIVIEPVHSYQDACVIFNPVLFASIRSGFIKEGTLTAHEEVSVIERDTLKCIIRARINKKSSVSTMNSYESTLDFDFLDLTPMDINDVFSNKLPELNKNHFDLFMWAASDELIKLLEIK